MTLLREGDALWNAGAKAWKAGKQAEAIAYALRALLEQRFDGVSPLRECLDDLEALLNDEGLDALTDERERPAFLVRPRMVDVGAAVSRYRKLELAGRPDED